MKNEKTKRTVMIVLGVVIICIAALLIASIVTSRTKSLIIDTSTSQKTEVANVQNCSLPDYSSNGYGGSKSGAQTKAAADTTNGVLDNNTDYIIPNSNSVALTDADLAGLSAKELTYARNEIYARYGRVFQSSELSQYFHSKSWYRESTGYSDSQVTPLEEANAVFISEYQTRNNLTYDPQ